MSKDFNHYAVQTKAQQGQIVDKKFKESYICFDHDCIQWSPLLEVCIYSPFLGEKSSKIAIFGPYQFASCYAIDNLFTWEHCVPFNHLRCPENKNIYLDFLSVLRRYLIAKFTIYIQKQAH